MSEFIKDTFTAPDSTPMPGVMPGVRGTVDNLMIRNVEADESKTFGAHAVILSWDGDPSLELALRAALSAVTSHWPPSQPPA